MMRTALASLSVAALGGCLAVPHTPAAMCQSNDDCDHAHGEVCSEGTCWGDPPNGAFAAVLAPPATRSDLVGVQIAALDIPANGYLTDLTLGAPLAFSGRVEAACDACDTSTIAAHLTLSRPSAFLGGPRVTASTTSMAGATADSFSVDLAQTGSADAPYELTIFPDDDPNDAMAAATIVPPLRTTLTLTGNVDQTFTLGGTGQAHLTGSLLDSVGGPLADYDVVALGQWDPSEPAQRVSNIVHSSDGSFDLVLSDAVVGTVTIQATPSATNMTSGGATLQLADVSVTGSNGDLTIQQPGTLGKLKPLDILVTGMAASGSVGPISGVTVTVTAAVGGTSSDAPTVATFSATATTGDDGTAHVVVFDGMGEYAVDLAPPADSTSGALYNQTLDPVQGSPSYQLPTRVSLHGTVVDAHGDPVSAMQVTAQPAQKEFACSGVSLTFSGTSDQDGNFAVLVDPTIGNVAATYDLQLQPASETAEPVSTVPEVRVDPSKPSVAVGTVTLPTPAFLHGAVTDFNGMAVAMASLTVYAVLPKLPACAIGTAPAGAQPAATAQADGTGTVQFSLPR